MDFNDIWAVGSAILSGFTEVQAHINRTPATSEEIEVAKSGLLLPAISGCTVNKEEKVVDDVLAAGKTGISLPNPHGAKGKPDHQAAVDMLEKKQK